MIISTATQSMIAVLNTIRGFSAVSRPNNVFLPPQEFEHFHRILCQKSCVFSDLSGFLPYEECNMHGAWARANRYFQNLLH